LILLTVFELLPKTCNFTICSIFSNSGHVGWCTASPDTILKLDTLVMIQTKFCYHWSCTFRGEDFWKSLRRTTDDGRQVIAKAHMTLWVRWTKNVKTYCFVYFSSKYHTIELTTVISLKYTFFVVSCQLFISFRILQNLKYIIYIKKKRHINTIIIMMENWGQIDWGRTGLGLERLEIHYKPLLLPIDLKEISTNTVSRLIWLWTYSTVRDMIPW
jgi:hypothetical protein